MNLTVTELSDLKASVACTNIACYEIIEENTVGFTVHMWHCNLI